MEVKYYIAYENIDRFSPVFLFYDNGKKKHYVYSSHDLNEVDNSDPLCVGVCINDVKRGENAKVVNSGNVNIRYYGDYPSTFTDVYALKNYNGNSLKGYTSYLGDKVEPVTRNNSSIIKLGTIYPSNYNNEKIPKDAFVPRIVKVVLGIQNENYNYYNSNVLDELSKDKIENKNFSIYDIGTYLKSAINSQTSVNAIEDVIYKISHSRSKEELYFAINEYCEQIYYNIPFITTPGVSGYVKRLTAIMSSGQVVFDTENKLRISNENAELKKIPLVSNPFNVTEFSLSESVIKNHLYPYIDTTNDDNSFVVGSYYLSSIAEMNEIIKNTINGAGFTSKLCPVLNKYTYTVSYFIGTTNEYNKYNSDGIILCLSWYKDEAVAEILKEIYHKYLTIHTQSVFVYEQLDKLLENKSTASTKPQDLKIQLEKDIENNNLANVVSKIQEFELLGTELNTILNQSENLKQDISNAKQTSAAALTNIDNEDYGYDVKFYIDNAYQDHEEITQNEISANTVYTETQQFVANFNTLFMSSIESMIIDYIVSITSNGQNQNSLTLNGNPSIIIEKDYDLYIELGADTNTNETVKIYSNVDEHTIGTYHVAYIAIDGTTIRVASRVVTVQDTRKPVITLNGGHITLERAVDTYVEQGATADSGETVVISGNVNTDVVGTYAITYTATDSSGNIGTAIRVVVVQDTISPVLTLSSGGSGSFGTETKIVPADYETNGIAPDVVAAYGNYIVSVDLSTNVGFIYETTNNSITWNETVITDLNNVSGDHISLGCAIDSSGINGDIVVFAGQKPGDPGQNHVYKKVEGVWTKISNFSAPPNPNGYNSYNGKSVSIYGNYIAVGRYAANISLNETTYYTGLVDIFKTTDGGNNWSLVKSIYPHDYSAWPGRFGWSTSLHNNTLVVGASFAAFNSGAVYIYEKDQDGPGQWGHVKNVGSNDIMRDGDEYGGSVSVYGDWLCVGAKGHNSNYGAVYIFQRNFGGTNAWGRTQKIVPSDLVRYDWFGYSVSIYDNKLLMGKLGKIYFYELDNETTWSEVDKFTSSDSYPYHYMGLSCSVTEKYAVSVINSHAIYLYNITSGSDSGPSGPQITLEVGSTYIEQGATADTGETVTITITKNVNGENVVVNSVDTSLVDVVYTITYSATDSSGNVGTTTRTVTIVDSTPVITLNGGHITLERAVDTYVEQGATADTGDPIIISGNVNTDVVGTYAITYSATNSSGNVGTATRIVVVQDTLSPVVTLNGGHITLERAVDTYVEQGATADTGETVVISGNVNTNVDGTYAITYTATDSSGNIGFATRNVVVQDTISPVLTLSSNSSGGFGTETKIVPADTETNGLAPDVVAAYGNYIVSVDSSMDVGFIYETTDNGLTWNETVITDMDAVSGDNISLGCAIDSSGINGDIVVFSGQKRSDPGHNYVYKKVAGVWNKISNFSAPPNLFNYNSNNGKSVSIYGNYIAVGRYTGGLIEEFQINGKISFAGVVDIYITADGGNNWSLVKTVYPPDFNFAGYFGWSVSIHNNTLAVGAYSWAQTGTYKGAVYIFQKDQDGPGQWGYVKTVFSDDLDSGDNYGYSVSLYGDWLCVGAKGNNFSRGAAYIHHRNEGGTNVWGQTQKIVPSGTLAYEYFGSGTSLYNNKLLIGKLGTGNSGRDAIYFYELDGTTWSEVDNFSTSDSYRPYYIGLSVAVSENYAVSVIGSHAIYLYNITSGTVSPPNGSEITLEKGSEYVEYGATSNGGESIVITITKNVNGVIETVSSVDTNVDCAVYTITYSATDSGGNVGTATRTVTIIDSINPPVITLNGGDVTMEVGSAYIELGAYSNCGETIVITSNLDTNNVGNYTVTYSATDSSGNVGIATRSVVVTQPASPPPTYQFSLIDASEIYTFYGNNNTVAMSEEYIAFSTTETSDYVNSGKIYIYTKDGGSGSIINNPSYNNGTDGDFGDYMSFLDNDTLITVSDNYIFLYIHDWETGQWNLKSSPPLPYGGALCLASSYDSDTTVVGYNGGVVIYKRTYTWDDVTSTTTVDFSMLQDINKSVTDPLFGHSVDLYYDVMVISSRANNKVYLYRFNNITGLWEERQTLTVDNPQSFGKSVSIFAETIAIGETGRVIDGLSLGQVYLFSSYDDGVTWSSTPSTVISCPVAINNSEFGKVVRIYNDTLMISGNHSDNNLSGGACFRYHYNGQTWSLVNTFESEWPISNGRFGGNISLYGTDLIINNYYSSVSRDTFLYIYYNITTDFPGWSDDVLYDRRIVGQQISSETIKLSEVSDYNNVTVRMSADYLLVFQPYLNNSNFNTVYVYDKNNNYSVESLQIPPPLSGGAISPNNVIVIHTQEIVYIYTRVNGSWSVKQTLDIKTSWSEAGESMLHPILTGIDIDVNNTIVTMDNKYVFVFMDDGNNTWSLSHYVLAQAYSGWNKVSIYDNTFIYSDTQGDVILDDNVNNPGIVHVYKYLNGSWNKLQTLYDSVQQEFQSTGTEIKIHKNIIAVLTTTNFSSGEQNSRVLIFKSSDNGNTWPSVPTTVLDKLQLPDYVRMVDVDFQYRLCLYDNVLMVGSSNGVVSYKFTTDDDGATWSTVATIIGNNKNLIYSAEEDYTAQFTADLYKSDYAVIGVVWGSSPVQYNIYVYENVGSTGGTDSYTA